MKKFKTPKILTEFKEFITRGNVMGLAVGMIIGSAFTGIEPSVHWDMVLIQRPEYGGGEIWFDDVLIRKDGRFVLDELQCLNPENLK